MAGAKQRTLLGVITPSSNTVLEPLTSAMVADVAGVTAHFARFSVTEISKGTYSTAQFDVENQLIAADMLADANVDAIVWSGTAASWLGFDVDERLCEAITARTGAKSGSSVLAINELFRLCGVKTFGLVSPYTHDIQGAIIANYAGHGFECIAERHLGKTNNFSFSEVTEAQIEEMVLAVGEAGPDAIVIMCTNMQGARIAPELEERLAIPVFDSTSAAVWSGLRLAGIAPGRVAGWGRMFGMD